MNKKKPDENDTKLSELIKNSDQAILITAKQGNIEVSGIKNINFSYEAKGLIIGALDRYSIRPIINSVNSYTDTMLSHIKKLGDDIKKSLGIEEREPEKPQAPQGRLIKGTEIKKDKKEEEKSNEKKEQEKNEEV